MVRPPHRVSVILDGESLLNDASALLIYKLALVAMAAGGTLNVAQIAPTMLFVLAGSVLLAFGLAEIARRLLPRFRDPPSAIVMQFVATFGVYILADRLGPSWARSSSRA